MSQRPNSLSYPGGCDSPDGLNKHYYKNADDKDKYKGYELVFSGTGWALGSRRAVRAVRADRLDA